jgi:uncharacterized protein (DUF697 family)
MATMNGYARGNGFGRAPGGAPAQREPAFGEEYGRTADGRGALPGSAELYAELSELTGEFESPLGEAEESELAAELLEVSDEAELEQFLGKLIKGVADKAGKFLKSGTGRALGGILKNVAKAALPIAGSALGSLVAPGLGTAIGGQLGSMASSLLGEELEQFDQPEREFETARRVVRFSAAAARNAAFSRPEGDAQAAGRAAALAAARRYAPGLYRRRRFRIYARPTPWYWPQPAPVDCPPPPVPPPPAAASAAGMPGPSPDEGQEPDVPAAEPAPQTEAGAGPFGGAGMPRPAAGRGRPVSGRWVRRGDEVVILGA